MSNKKATWEPVSADSVLIARGAKTLTQRIGAAILGCFCAFIGLLGFTSALSVVSDISLHTREDMATRMAALIVVPMISGLFVIVAVRLIRASLLKVK